MRCSKLFKLIPSTPSDTRIYQKTEINNILDVDFTLKEFSKPSTHIYIVKVVKSKEIARIRQCTQFIVKKVRFSLNNVKYCIFFNKKLNNFVSLILILLNRSWNFFATILNIMIIFHNISAPNPQVNTLLRSGDTFPNLDSLTTHKLRFHFPYIYYRDLGLHHVCHSVVYILHKIKFYYPSHI